MLKALGNPPSDVKQVFMCVLMYLDEEKTEKPWPKSIMLMKNVPEFLEKLTNHDPAKVKRTKLKKIKNDYIN